MKEYVNVVKNYGIVVGKVLEYTRELTRREAAYRWVSQSIGGTSWSHMVSSCGDFSCGGF